MIIAPSLFAANTGKLLQEVETVENAGASYLHLDIMDGHFVPNLSFGPSLLTSIRAYSKMVFDVHLMVEKPLCFCEQFIRTGANIITIHAEIEEEIEKIYQVCRINKTRFGLSICPETPLNEIISYLPMLDIMLIMGIHPGFGGQEFIPETLKRIEEAKDLRERFGAHYLISVDGGVNEKTATAIIRSGADILVIGTAIFGKENKQEAMDNITRCNCAEEEL